MTSGSTPRRSRTPVTKTSRFEASLEADVATKRTAPTCSSPGPRHSPHRRRRFVQCAATQATGCVHPSPEAHDDQVPMQFVNGPGERIQLDDQQPDGIGSAVDGKPSGPVHTAAGRPHLPVIEGRQSFVSTGLTWTGSQEWAARACKHFTREGMPPADSVTHLRDVVEVSASPPGSLRAPRRAPPASRHRGRPSLVVDHQPLRLQRRQRGRRARTCQVEGGRKRCAVGQSRLGGDHVRAGRRRSGARSGRRPRRAAQLTTNRRQVRHRGLTTGVSNAVPHPRVPALALLLGLRRGADDGGRPSPRTVKATSREHEVQSFASLRSHTPGCSHCFTRCSGSPTRACLRSSSWASWEFSSDCRMNLRKGHSEAEHHHCQHHDQHGGAEGRRIQIDRRAAVIPLGSLTNRIDGRPTRRDRPPRLPVPPRYA